LGHPVYAGRSVMTMTVSKDDLEPRGPKTGGTRQPDTMALPHETFKSERDYRVRQKVYD